MSLWPVNEFRFLAHNISYTQAEMEEMVEDAGRVLRREGGVSDEDVSFWPIESVVFCDTRQTFSITYKSGQERRTANFWWKDNHWDVEWTEPYRRASDTKPA